MKEEVREEVVYDTLSTVPQHTVRNLPPFTNVSLRLVLSNPEGRKESEELLVLTDEDGMTSSTLFNLLKHNFIKKTHTHAHSEHVLVYVSVPGSVPVDSILGSSYEQQISLSWREPVQTYGLIRQYEVRLTSHCAPNDKTPNQQSYFKLSVMFSQI